MARSRKTYHKTARSQSNLKISQQRPFTAYSGVPDSWKKHPGVCGGDKQGKRWIASATFQKRQAAYWARESIVVSAVSAGDGSKPWQHVGEESRERGE